MVASLLHRCIRYVTIEPGEGSQAARQQIEPMRRALADLRCATHGGIATVRLLEKPEKPGWEIESCCDQLREKAEERLVGRRGL